MKKALIVSLMAIVAWCGSTAVASAQASATANVTVTATVGAFAKLSLDQTTLGFGNTDPDTASIPGDHVITITARARTSAAGAVALTVVADGDLVSAGNPSIPIGNITWTAGGAAGYIGGTMNNTTPQNVFTHTGSHANLVGTQTFALANSWTYATGVYAAHLTYTLTAP